MIGPVNITINKQRPVRLPAPEQKEKKIAFATPDLTSREVSDVGKVINSRWIANGPTVRRFEAEIANRAGKPHPTILAMIASTVKIPPNAKTFGWNNVLTSTIIPITTKNTGTKKL